MQWLLGPFRNDLKLVFTMLTYESGRKRGIRPFFLPGFPLKSVDFL